MPTTKIVIKAGTHVYDGNNNKFTLSKTLTYTIIKESREYYFFYLRDSAEYRVLKTDIENPIETGAPVKVTNISKNITYNEAVRSSTAKKYGLDNTPNQKQLENMMLLAENIFQPLREHFKTPIGINSFFRSVKVNTKVGGSATSQHCKGEAMDLDADAYGGVTNKQLFDYIRTYLDFDQMIWEFGDETNPNWVHVSYNQNGNRNMKLISKYKNGKTVYDIYPSDPSPSIES